MKPLDLLREINSSRSIPKTNWFTKSESSKMNYVIYRIARPLIKLRYARFRKKHAPAPWLSESAILFFSKWLEGGDKKGCEFGSGFSSLFFVTRVAELTSVEHHPGWYNDIKTTVAGYDHKAKFDYRLVEQNAIGDQPERLEELDAVDPEQTFDYRKDYYNYMMAIQDYPDEYFDFIIVDGRARTECVFVNLRKLKTGGLLILDNSERSRYDLVFSSLKKWDSVNTTNGLTDTTFWQKA